MILQIAEQIKKLRNDRNLTQSELAKLLGVSRSAVNSWEQGTNNPTLSFAVAISEVFNVSLDYLIGRSEENIDISELSDDEREAIRRVVSCLKKHNRIRLEL